MEIPVFLEKKESNKLPVGVILVSLPYIYKPRKHNNRIKATKLHHKIQQETCIVLKKCKCKLTSH
jgi:hypothetical protein